MDRTCAYDAQLAVARRYITLHKDTQAGTAAFELARALMEYRADTPLAADQRLQQAWEIQRHRGADPWEVVARVVAFYLFMDHRPGYFRNQKAEDVALGRLCLHSMPLGGHRYSATVYAPAGELIRRHLGQFALALIRKVNKDADRVAQLKAKSAAL
ncbi:MAG: hypothetical protein M3Z20_00860 [Chloroflexota bacterium]|nr:hypothetical protein [Chloroflexota bacterium]